MSRTLRFDPCTGAASGSVKRRRRSANANRRSLEAVAHVIGAKSPPRGRRAFRRWLESFRAD